jgi:glycosyltransferase involved in cell wall biosynthesis
MSFYSYSYDSYDSYDDKNRIKPLITFVIPSIGRKSLKRTINSLKNINNKNWNAIIVFDGIEPNIYIEDIYNRIKVIKSDKKLGEGNNSAGNVRNIAFEHVNTKWVGFVDDDDTLNPTYIDDFLDHLETNPNLDVIIFRMIYKDGKILPPIDENEFFIHKVGISFCMKTLDANKYKFIPSQVEDFNLLDKLRNDKKNIIISKHINYNVGF